MSPASHTADLSKEVQRSTWGGPQPLAFCRILDISLPFCGLQSFQEWDFSLILSYWNPHLSLPKKSPGGFFLHTLLYGRETESCQVGQPWDLKLDLSWRKVWVIFLYQDRTWLLSLGWWRARKCTGFSTQTLFLLPRPEEEGDLVTTPHW